MKQQAILFCAALAAGLSFGMPARAEPPPWAPAHGYRAKQAREYQYVYYPAQQVYYAPQTNSWFWLNGGSWQVGVNLPSRYRISSSGGVSVMLHSAQPYVEHVYVEEHYGRPWREQHRHHQRHHGYGRHHGPDRDERHHEHGGHGNGHDHGGRGN